MMKPAQQLAAADVAVENLKWRSSVAVVSAIAGHVASAATPLSQTVGLNISQALGQKGNRT